MPPAPALHVDSPDRRTNSLMGMVVVLVVLVAALIVVRKLQVRAMLEACLMSQQPSCEVTVDRLRVSRITSRMLGAGE